MVAMRGKAFAGLALLASSLSLAAGINSAEAADLTVESRQVEDIKLVYGTVQATVDVGARARISGTLEVLDVTEGSFVNKGDVIARIVDEKLNLQAKALEARILAARSQVTKAELDYNRAEELFKRGTVAKASIDQLETALVVARNTLKATEAERAVLDQQMAEGDVLAPTAGRVLDVPVTAGSVVMGGEVVASVAADGFLLRIEVPERHASFIELGDPVKLGAPEIGGSAEAREGEIVKIYPQIKQGRVIADAKVAGLGDFFVGERTQAAISVGTRDALIIPVGYIDTRFGLDFVRLAREDGEPLDIVVQLGAYRDLEGEPGVEILSGLKAGDRLVMP
ncbi:efflux RND transporter periplasmic adaptor subunit [Breoghania sp.]|uniref:efflux RND transporter periplasmic adaptor subunit n=1 Tax=Breoghania sp. TaxID=2065378 RepID=UPI002AA87C6F|nr:efflux RND transporter periplasmic adaptor subunit [Breoghania sp.]